MHQVSKLAVGSGGNTLYVERSSAVQPTGMAEAGRQLLLSLIRPFAEVINYNVCPNSYRKLVRSHEQTFEPDIMYSQMPTQRFLSQIGNQVGSSPIIYSENMGLAYPQNYINPGA